MDKLATVKRETDETGVETWSVYLNAGPGYAPMIGAKSELEARHIAGAINFGAVWIA